MWKRYYTSGSTGKNMMMAGQLLVMVAAALSEYDAHVCLTAAAAAAAAAILLAMLALTQIRRQIRLKWQERNDGWAAAGDGGSSTQ
jgi:hypothetical protein